MESKLQSRKTQWWDITWIVMYHMRRLRTVLFWNAWSRPRPPVSQSQLRREGPGPLQSRGEVKFCRNFFILMYISRISSLRRPISRLFKFCGPRGACNGYGYGDQGQEGLWQRQGGRREGENRSYRRFLGTVWNRWISLISRWNSKDLSYFSNVINNSRGREHNDVDKLDCNNAGMDVRVTQISDNQGKYFIWRFSYSQDTQTSAVSWVIPEMW